MNFRWPRLTATVKGMLILLTVSFIVVAIVQNLASVPAFQWLALSVNQEANAQAMFLNLAWQPFTYWLVEPPVPDALLGFGLTLLFIYFFLAPFEEAYGAKRAIQLSVVGVLSAALPCILLGFVVDPSRPLSGAEPIALAALGAFPVIAGNREILFMFVLPMKAWVVIALGLGISFLMAILATDPFVFVEQAGALGGGYAFARWMTRPRNHPTKKASKRKGGPELRVLRGGGADDDDRPRWLN